MPDYDPTRIAELLAEGKSLREIADTLDGPDADAQRAADAQRLAGARAALQAQSTPPGEEPGLPLGQDMMEAGFAAQGGARARPSGGFGPKARDAALDRLFTRAKAGDPAAVFKRADEQWAAATDRWRADQG
jgi:hypothetical protein